MNSPRLTSVGFAVLVAACADSPGTTSPATLQSADQQRGRSESVLVQDSHFPGSVAVGGSLPASVTPLPPLPLTWTSESPSIATVSGDGTITGVSPGTSLIRAAVLPPSAAGTPHPLATAAARVAVFPGLVELTLGGRHACARTASLEIWCWGHDNYAELGQLDRVESCQTPGGIFTCSTTPRRNLAALAFTQISAGEFRTCGLTASGEAHCWGTNNSGELGTATGSCGGGPCNPEPVKVSGSVQFSWIGTGDDFACGLTSTGAAYCMGLNAYGQLGASTAGQCAGVPCSLAPLQVPGTFTSLTVRGFHACGLTPSGAAYCWGWNAWGQLGNGTISAPLGGSSVPVEVAGGHQFVAISAGKQNTCALEASGKAWCWGANEGGQIGDGSPPTGPDVAYSIPREVSGSLFFASIAEGLQHTCALTPAGEAYCWGANHLGQLGDGTTTLRLTPTRVSLTVPLAEISAGRSGTCGRTATGRTYCWGTNLYGRLGIGTESPNRSTLPVGVGGVP